MHSAQTKFKRQKERQRMRDERIALEIIKRGDNHVIETLPEYHTPNQTPSPQKNSAQTNPIQPAPPQGRSTRDPSPSSKSLWLKFLNFTLRQEVL